MSMSSAHHDDGILDQSADASSVPKSPLRPSHSAHTACARQEEEKEAAIRVTALMFAPRDKHEADDRKVIQ